MKLNTKYRVVCMVLFLLLTGKAGAQTFEDYFATAAENNPGLQARYLEFEAALKRIPQAGSLPDPRLSAGYFISPVETRVGPQVAKISLSQMFPWFGTLKAREDVIALEAEAKFMAFIDARNYLYYEVKKAWYPLFELKRLMEIEKENLEILRIYLRLATTHFENGKGTMVDVLRVESMLSESELSLKLLSDKELPLLTVFNRLLNRPDTVAVSITDTLADIEWMQLLEKDSTFLEHPAVLALDKSVNALNASREVQRKAGFPGLGIGVDYVFVNQRTGGMGSDNGKDAIMPMVSTSIPIFRGKYRASVEEMELMAESKEMQKEQLVNAFHTQYAMALYDWESQAELLLLYNDQIRRYEQMLELQYTSYSVSGRDFEELLRLQEQILRYEKLKVLSRTRLEEAAAKLTYLLIDDNNE